MKNKILLVSRVLLGIVFVFSGFVKAVDPLGFNYKIEDYLIAFGWDMFLPLTFVMAVGLSCLEFVIGANLLLGANVKITAPFALLFMIFMTPLTLYLAINNPVTDCGCFGDALVISNWQTFYKNVILAAVAICVFVLRKEGRQVIKNRTQWLLTAFSGVFIVLFSLHCYYNLPIFDFRPYKVGNNIVEGMTVPHNAPQDVYKTIFVYEKNGKKKEFTLENFPDGDSSWTFVKQQSTLIEKGYEPPIHDFTIETEDDGDITSEVLRNKGYTFLLISSKMSEANLSNQDKINRIYQFAQNNGYGFYCMSSSFGTEVENFKQKTGAKYPFAVSDEIMLKTVIRSNPGLVLIKNGTILNHWHYRNLPEFKEPLQKSAFGKVQKPNNIVILLIVLCCFLAPTGLIFLSDKFDIQYINSKSINKY